jgi:hypothetical protein
VTRTRRPPGQEDASGRGTGARRPSLDALAGEPPIPSRFGHIVIASGDNAFTTCRLLLRHRGLQITVTGPARDAAPVSGRPG